MRKRTCDNFSIDWELCWHRCSNKKINFLDGKLHGVYIERIEILQFPGWFTNKEITGNT